MSVSIGYKDIFNDYETVDIKQLIGSIPTKNSLEVIGHFLAQLHTVERSTTVQIHFLKMWTGRLPKDVCDVVENYVNEIINKPFTDFNFLNNISSLILIEILIANDNGLPFEQTLTPEQELSLFKAYLICTQIWTDKQVLNSFSLSNEDEIIKTLLPNQLPYQEILEFKDFQLQAIKAIHFFRFCETNEFFKDYLSLFLEEYSLQNWQQYLVHVIELYVRKFDNLKTPSILFVPDEHPDVINFLESLTVDPKRFVPSDDFLGIREKPVYRIDSNSFLFLNLNFLIDKLFQGIQFDFAKVLINKSANYKGRIFRNYADFKNAYGGEFSEAGLFYSVINYTFQNSKYLKYTGDEIKELMGDGGPDYYMRDGNKQYVFEFKDILMGAPIKHSYNYEEILNEILKKLVRNQQGTSKGVSQLVNVIAKIRNEEFNVFDNYNHSSTKIYPILVLTDFSFHLPGINYLLNIEFRNLLNAACLENTHNIKDLVIIDIDTLIKFQDYFRNKHLKLNSSINGFYEYKNNKKDLTKRIASFDMYLQHAMRQVKYKGPKMLMEEMMKILPVE